MSSKLLGSMAFRVTIFAINSNVAQALLTLAEPVRAKAEGDKPISAINANWRKRFTIYLRSDESDFLTLVNKWVNTSARNVNEDLINVQKIHTLRKGNLGLVFAGNIR